MKYIKTGAFICLFFIISISGCGLRNIYKPEPKPAKPVKEELPVSEPAQIKATPKMVEEYAMIYQIPDLKKAEFYLTHPDYAKKNPYVPTDQDRAYYEIKFLEKMHPDFKEAVEQKGYKEALSVYLVHGEGVAVNSPDKQVIDDLLKENKQMQSEQDKAIELYEKGYIDDAIEHMKNALQYQPESPTMLYDLGVMYMKKESYRKAMLSFQKCLEYLNETSYTNINIKLHPKIYLGASTNLGMVYIYFGLYNEAIDILTKAVKFSPRDFNANWNLAVAYFNVKDNSKAAAQLKECIKLDPDNAEIHNAVGLIYYNMGLYFIALDEFRMSAKLKPSNTQYSYNEGIVLATLGRHDAAIQAFSRASGMKEADDMQRILSEQTRANKTKDLYNKGCSAMESRDTANAIEYFKAALEVNPDMVEAYINLGYCYRLKRDAQKQIYYLEEAARLRPNMPDVYYNLGLAYSDAGMYLNARYALEKAVELNPSFKDAHFSLGTALYRYNRFTDAAMEFEKCIELSPGWFEAHTNLGTCYMKLKNIDGAISEFKEALLLKPNSSEANYNLGAAYMKAKKPGDAMTFFQKAVKIDPGNIQAKKMLEELESAKVKPSN